MHSIATELYNAAAMEGNLFMLKWMFEHTSQYSDSFPWNKDTCAYAAESGNVEVLEWLREKGCPLDITDCACYAAENGHVNVLEYLRSKLGSSFEDAVCAAAIDGGDEAVIKYIQLCRFDDMQEKLNVLHKCLCDEADDISSE
jgi:hypothetical protein